MTLQPDLILSLGEPVVNRPPPLASAASRTPCLAVHHRYRVLGGMGDRHVGCTSLRDAPQPAWDMGRLKSTHPLMWTYLTQSYVDLLELDVFPAQLARNRGFSQHQCSEGILRAPDAPTFVEAVALDGTCYTRNSPHSFIRREGWRIPRV